jgi:hypothetical protein
MKLSPFLFSAVLAGPCSSASSDAPPAASPAPITSGAATVAPAAATAAAAAPESAPQSGPCALLAQKCSKCPHGVVQTACNLALTAGALDPSACTNALNDKDIKSECGGGATPVSPAPTMTAPPPTPSQPAAGSCAELAQKCRRCPPGAVATACNFAVAAGQLDVHACANALSDKDIKAQCN